MNCEQYRQLISALVDKELNSEERGSLDKHLADCSACKQYAEQVRELERLTSEWEASTMPPDVEQAVLARTKAKPRGWLARVWNDSYSIPRPLAWAAMLLLVLLSVNGLLNRGGSAPEEELIISPEDSLHVQHIILTKADVVQTYTTGSAPSEL